MISAKCHNFDSSNFYTSQKLRVSLNSRLSAESHFNPLTPPPPPLHRLRQTRLSRRLYFFDIRVVWRSTLSVRVPGCQKYKRRLNPVWHRMLYSCTHTATVGFKGLNWQMTRGLEPSLVCFRTRQTSLTICPTSGTNSDWSLDARRSQSR